MCRWCPQREPTKKPRATNMQRRIAAGLLCNSHTPMQPFCGLSLNQFHGVMGIPPGLHGARPAACVLSVVWCMRVRKCVRTICNMQAARMGLRHSHAFARSHSVHSPATGMACFRPSPPLIGLPGLQASNERPSRPVPKIAAGPGPPPPCTIVFPASIGALACCHRGVGGGGGGGGGRP